MKLKCPKCNKEVKSINGRSKKVQVALLILGFLSVGLGWLILLVYRLVKPKYYCPDCGRRLKT